MSPYNTLGLLVIIILIVWWALRRSAAMGDKETPAAGGHEEHATSEHGEHVNAAVRVETNEPPTEPEVAAVPVAAVAPEVNLEPEPATEPTPAPAPLRTVEITPDNLVIIEGIGPRISGILKTAGITTFVQLAEMEPEQIKEVLTRVDERLGRISDPTSWPQQAGLAARREMEALQALQDSLKAGRKE